jgi:hypothetical protein
MDGLGPSLDGSGDGNPRFCNFISLQDIIQLFDR